MGVWYLDNIAQASLGQALLSSTFRNFDAPEAGAAQQCVPCLTVADQATAAPVLESSHFGFRFKRAIAPQEMNTPDAVEEALDSIKGTGRFRPKVADMAKAIKQVTDDLAEVGLLKEDKERKKKSRRVQFYQKPTWDELTDDAKSEAERLQIPRSVFG